jgi:two-component system OmpR family sensor kinase
MANLGIRWRLTIAYGVILTALLAGLAVFLYRQQESFLVDNAASRLESQVLVASNALPGGDPLADPARTSEALGAAVGGLDTSATLHDTAGELLGDGDPLALDEGLYEDASSGATVQRVVERDGDRVIVVLVPLRDDRGDVAAIAQVDASLDSVDASLDRLLVLLTIGVVVAHVVGLGLIFAATSWSLAPLGRIIDVCRSIAHGAYGDRSRLPRGGDELGELGRAFDAMIEQVQATVGQRERSEVLTRQFAADASHELKSPLTVIGGYVDVLMRGGAEDRAQLDRALAGIQRETERMSHLINDLLALAQLEAGSRAMQRHEVRIADLLREIHEESRLRSASRELRLALDGDARVELDEDALRQALRNLVDNAVRHTDTGGVIAIGLTSDASAAVISVTDSGSGIDARHLPHIFERFYRGDPSRNRSGGEAGLGLAITRALIEANGGSIRAESPAGGGAAFVIRLPLASAAPEKLDVESALSRL